MKTKLKEITDSTITELLANDIILPSNYFQCFDKHAKTIDLDIDNESFEKELSELILDEFNEINAYVNDAVKTIDTAAGITLEAQQAIKDNNTLVLKNLYSQIKTLQSQLQEITDNVYKDYLTKVHNKKWIYHKFLTRDANFKEDNIIILVDVVDYEYISDTYNKLISNNLLVFISKYLKNKFAEENLDFNISRYLTNKFIISVNSEEIDQIETIMSTVSNVLYNTTLKSNSGVMIKPTFDHSVTKVKKDQAFHESLDGLLKNIEEARES